MTQAEHHTRHQHLHEALHELIADWFEATGHVPSHSTVAELVAWSRQQMEVPTHAWRCCHPEPREGEGS